jgi:hypothetical protein
MSMADGLLRAVVAGAAAAVTSDPVVSATAVFAYNRIKVFTQSFRFPIVSSNADIGVQW